MPSSLREMKSIRSETFGRPLASPINRSISAVFVIPALTPSILAAKAKLPPTASSGGPTSSRSNCRRGRTRFIAGKLTQVRANGSAQRSMLNHQGVDLFRGLAAGWLLPAGRRGIVRLLVLDPGLTGGGFDLLPERRLGLQIIHQELSGGKGRFAVR